MQDPCDTPVTIVAATTRVPPLNPYSPVIRLLLIPVLIYLAWLLEVFLLAGNNRLLLHPEPAGIAIYTIVACILTGMVIPLVCLRKAFITGTVNMFQIGFRTLRRTLLACSLTGALAFGMIVFLSPFGQDRIAFANAFLLLLPTATATVMICWVLVGTHVQAYVRDGGAAVSIAVGVVVTAILFTAVALVLDPSLRQEGTVFWPVCIGIGTALFFFAVRDVYATVILAAVSMVIAGGSMFDPVSLHGTSPAIYASSLLAGAVLAAIHIWFFRHYRTIMVPAGR